MVTDRERAGGEADPVRGTAVGFTGVLGSFMHFMASSTAETGRSPARASAYAGSSVATDAGVDSTGALGSFVHSDAERSTSDAG